MTPSGFVLLDKNPGDTSFKALFPLKRVFSTKRVGHAGTLDLRASGLIVAAIGRATRLLPFVEAKDKCYTFRLHLGYETDTLEWDGDVVAEGDRSHVADRAALESILPQFIGDIDQIPPRYCAVKIDGRRASDWAERGKDFEMKPRRIHIESLKIVGKGGVTEGCSGKCFATFDLECVCSKGTYIRSLGRDLARALGTYGCVSLIRRHRIGNITLDRAVKGENLTAENLVPVDKVLDYPVLRLAEDGLAVIRRGNWLPWKNNVEGVGPEGYVFVARENGEVLSLCRFEPGRIWPKYFLGGDE
ncbi:MAG: tRNA pseudouridine(55) synthase TruB [Fibrobacter sp.]|nr:tRNA pseudouridine(55) synthase TruB [Fibrobacter sp.]